jgi:hypothetical protein
MVGFAWAGQAVVDTPRLSGLSHIKHTDALYWTLKGSSAKKPTLRKEAKEESRLLAFFLPNLSVVEV